MQGSFTHSSSKIDNAFMNALHDLQRFDTTKAVESNTTPISVERILKETNQQISLYDLMVLSPTIREDTIRVLQSLPIPGSSGGHLPVLQGS